MIKAPRIKQRPARFLRTVLRCGFVLLVVGLFFVHHKYLSSSHQPLPPPPAVAGLLSSEESKVDNNNNNKDDDFSTPVHFIYTIGCGGASDHAWQLLQSNAVDSSFRAVGQRGKLTRLVSGCDDDDKLKRYMSQTILPERLNVVFMPRQERVNVPGGGGARTYVQANRPTALKYFFRLPEIQKEDSKTVYVVIDPDFVFRQRMPEEAIRDVAPKRFVSHAYSLASPSAYAHQAGLEAFKNDVNLCNRIKNKTSFRRFYGGVPYMLLREDWQTLLELWIPLIGPVLLRYPGIESDMISWALAAALAQFESRLRNDMMATCMSSEQADLTHMQKQIFLHLCQSYYVPETRSKDEYRVNLVSELPYIVTNKPWLKEAPYVYVFNKHWLRNSRLLDSCDVPLLLEPPSPPTPGSSSSSSSSSSSFAAAFTQTIQGGLDPHHTWHLLVLREAVAAYSKAVTEFRQEVAKCATGPRADQALIMHERHGSRFGGGWNHVVPVPA